MEGIKVRIKSMIRNTRKEKAFSQNSKKKKNSKNEDSLGTSGISLKIPISES